MRTSDAEWRYHNLQTLMKKHLIMSRIAIVALGVGALCLATTSSALNAYPPLRTGANADASKTSPSPAKGAAKVAGKLSAADKAFMMNAAKRSEEHTSEL